MKSEIIRSFSSILIFLIIIIQFIFNFFFEKTDFLYFELIAIFSPWIYFWFLSKSSFQKYYIALSNRKKVNFIIESLKIKTFNYDTFQEEYFKFISKKPYEEYDQNYVESELWFLLLDESYHHDAKSRRRKAKSISLTEFCVSLEIKRILLGCHEPRTMLQEVLSPVSTSEMICQLIKMATIHYDENFEKYYLSYCYTFYDKMRDQVFSFYSVYNPPIKSLINYIGKCFFTKSNPSYINYLDFSASFDYDSAENELIQNNFKKLKKITTL